MIDKKSSACSINSVLHLSHTVSFLNNILWVQGQVHVEEPEAPGTNQSHNNRPQYMDCLLWFFHWLHMHNS